MKLGGDLTNPALMYLKASLFLVAGSAAAGTILFEHPSLRTALLLGIAVWAFCRLYYFMFYVVERYIDPGFRFAGIGSFLLYLRRRRNRNPLQAPDLE